MFTSFLHCIFGIVFAIACLSCFQVSRTEGPVVQTSRQPPLACIRGGGGAPTSDQSVTGQIIFERRRAFLSFLLVGDCDVHAAPSIPRWRSPDPDPGRAPPTPGAFLGAKGRPPNPPLEVRQHGPSGIIFTPLKMCILFTNVRDRQMKSLYFTPVLKMAVSSNASPRALHNRENRIAGFLQFCRNLHYPPPMGSLPPPPGVVGPLLPGRGSEIWFLPPGSWSRTQPSDLAPDQCPRGYAINNGSSPRIKCACAPTHPLSPPTN